MKAIFYLDNVTFGSGHYQICEKLKQKQGINDVYYNHLFTAFYFEYDENIINKDQISEALSEYNIKSTFFENSLSIIEEKLVKKQPKIKKELIISSTIFALMLINILVYPFINHRLITININMFLNLLLIYIYFSSIKVGIITLKQKLINDNTNSSIAIIISFLLSLGFNYTNISISFYFHIITSFLITLKILYCYTLNYFKLSEFSDDKFLQKNDIKQDDLNKKEEVLPNPLFPNVEEDVSGFTHVDKSMYTSQIPIITKANMYLTDESTIKTENESISKYKESIIEALSSKYYLTTSLSYVYKYLPPVTLILSLICFIVYLITLNNLPLAFGVFIALALTVSYEIFEFITPLNLISFFKKISKDGIFVKNINAIENIENCDYIMIEKKGVLVEEYPDVKDVFISAGVNPTDFYYIAYMLVKDDDSSYGIIIKNYLKNIHMDTIDAEAIKNITRKGISKEVIFKDYKFGDLDTFTNTKVDINKIEASVKKFHTHGKNSIIFAHKNKIIGIVTIQSILKDNAIETIEKLKALNKKVILLDDNDIDITKYYANKLNVEEYHSNLTNYQKTKLVDNLYTKGLNTMYVSNVKYNKSFPENSYIKISIDSSINLSNNKCDLVFNKAAIQNILTLMDCSKSTLKSINNQISLSLQSYGLLILVITLVPMLNAYVAPFISAVTVDVIAQSIFIYDMIQAKKRTTS